MRFLAALGSGTWRNIQPGVPFTSAYSGEAPSSMGWSSTAAQNDASAAASAQSKVRWVRVEVIGLLLA